MGWDVAAPRLVGEPAHTTTNLGLGLYQHGALVAKKGSVNSKGERRSEGMFLVEARFAAKEVSSTLFPAFFDWTLEFDKNLGVVKNNQRSPPLTPNQPTRPKSSLPPYSHSAKKQPEAVAVNRNAKGRPRSPLAATRKKKHHPSRRRQLLSASANESATTARRTRTAAQRGGRRRRSLLAALTGKESWLFGGGKDSWSARRSDVDGEHEEGAAGVIPRGHHLLRRTPTPPVMFAAAAASGKGKGGGFVGGVRGSESLAMTSKPDAADKKLMRLVFHLDISPADEWPLPRCCHPRKADRRHVCSA